MLVPKICPCLFISKIITLKTKHKNLDQTALKKKKQPAYFIKIEIRVKSKKHT